MYRFRTEQQKREYVVFAPCNGIFRFSLACNMEYTEFAQHAREYFYFVQHAMEYFDFAQQK